MTYSPRPRRFRKIAQARAQALGLITARQFLTNQGVPAAVADRFAGAFSRVVKKLGAAPTSATWTKRNGRARKTLAYNPATDLGALLGAFLTYAPGGKTKAARTAARAEWDGYRYGRRVLRRFAKALGTELELPPPPPVRVIPPVTARQQARLQSHVSGWASFLPPQYARRAVYVRLAAIVGIVVDTGARSGELVAMTVDDLAPGLTTATITRRPQGGWPGEVEELPLSAATRKAVAAWLELRGQLVGSLAGTPPRALWVSVRNGGRLGRAGLPIGPMALRRQYASAVAQLNADMKAQGVVGWVDLPRTLERLRHVDKTTRAPEVPVAGQPPNSSATAA